MIMMTVMMMMMMMMMIMMTLEIKKVVAPPSKLTLFLSWRIPMYLYYTALKSPSILVIHAQSSR